MILARCELATKSTKNSDHLRVRLLREKDNEMWGSGILVASLESKISLILLLEGNPALTLGFC